jgi:DNA-binding transcriptional LysR family regulator
MEPMHLTLRQIEVFNVVARHRNDTRAAEELHLSQPAVSMQIRQLEASIGLSMFEQVGKRLSPAAQAFKAFVLEQAEPFIRLPKPCWLFETCSTCSSE